MQRNPGGRGDVDGIRPGSHLDADLDVGRCEGRLREARSLVADEQGDAPAFECRRDFG